MYRLTPILRIYVTKDFFYKACIYKACEREVLVEFRPIILFQIVNEKRCYIMQYVKYKSHSRCGRLKSMVASPFFTYMSVFYVPLDSSPTEKAIAP